MTWPQVFCPRCETEYFGWAFGNPGYYVCSKCGAKLVVEEGIDLVFISRYNPEEDNSHLGAVLSIQRYDTKT